jgi:tetratricopeptide (TPR) repeat protein
LKVNPNSAPSLNGLGNCSLKKGNTNEAIEYFNQALKADANYKFAYNGLGVAYENIKDT